MVLIIILFIIILGGFIFMQQIEHSKLESRRDKLIKHAFSLLKNKQLFILRKTMLVLIKLNFLLSFLKKEDLMITYLFKLCQSFMIKKEIRPIWDVK